MKKLPILVTLMLLVTLSKAIAFTRLNPSFPMVNCCDCHCPLGDCFINGSTSICACNCDKNGNPHCTGAVPHICCNPTQFSNLQGVVTLYSNFNSSEGNAAASICQEMITLFSNNNYSLTDESDGGDIEAYENLLSEIESLQFSQSEWDSINQYLNNCSAGDKCAGN